MSRPSSPVDPSSDGVKEISDGGILSVEEAIGGDEGLKDWMGLVDLEWGKQTVEDGELPGSQVSDGVAEIEIPEELFEDVEPLCNCFMVGYFMNDAPHIGSILSTVNKIWASQGRTSKIDVQFIGKKTVLFLIEDEGVRNRVMRRKFWDIADVPLVVYEWNPETAQAPPDLSAMPLGVDLKNVPGYLYSKKSLSFLSRTAGKFVKLHLNTERCIRLDVARMLVEVDFQKPLPQKICFVDKDGTDVTVEVRYHWLPPCCGNCLKWGHNENDCQVVKPLTLLQRQEGEGPPAVNIDQQHDSEKPSGDVVSDLIVELEETVGSLVHHSRRGGLKGQVTQPQEDWALAQGRRSVTHSPPKIIHTAPRTISPGRFQVLQDLREEGEITGEGDDEESIRIENAVVEDVAANTTELVKRQGSHQGTRGKNKSGRKTIVSSKDLMHAVVHNHTKKTSFNKQ
ncbi:hypothetical protein Bca101_057772 [Brassica carinata]